MRNRENVYAHAEEKFVKTLKLFADGSKALFYDAENKKAVLTTEIEDLFLKGITVVNGENLLKPVAFKGGAVVCYDGEAAATFTATAPVEE